jgi:hypothetical protein
MTAVQFKHALRWHTRVTLTPYAEARVLIVDKDGRPPHGQENALCYTYNTTWFEHFTSERPFIHRSTEKLRETERQKRDEQEGKTHKVQPLSMQQHIVDLWERGVIALEKLANK